MRKHIAISAIVISLLTPCAKADNSWVVPVVGAIVAGSIGYAMGGSGKTHPFPPSYEIVNNGNARAAYATANMTVPVGPQVVYVQPQVVRSCMFQPIFNQYGQMIGQQQVCY